MRQLAWAFVIVAACGPKVHMDPVIEQDDPGAGVPAVHEEAEAPAAAPVKVAPKGPGVRSETIARASLEAVLDAGPGVFLHGFEVAPVMNGDKFAGWRLVQLMDGEHRFDGLDLAPGDVLLAVNGQPVSKPDQLAALWDSLRAANLIVCDLARGDARFQLRFEIAGAATPGAARP